MNFEKYKVDDNIPEGIKQICEEYQFPEKLRKIMDKRQTHTQNNTPQFGADLKARLKDVKRILEIDTELAPGLGFIHKVRLDPTPDGIAGILIHPKNGLMPPGTDERAYAEYLLEAECLVRQQLARREEEEMNEVTVNMDNLTTEEREQLLALVEKGNKKPFEVWKPTKDYEGCILQGDGSPSACGGLKITLDYYTQGRAFETREQAEFFSEQERILTQYKRLAEESWAGEAINWSDSSTKFALEYASHIFIQTYWSTRMQGVIHFKTRESLINAVKIIGEENIIKYLF